MTTEPRAGVGGGRVWRVSPETVDALELLLWDVLELLLWDDGVMPDDNEAVVPTEPGNELLVGFLGYAR
jgi:hypothetical protein